MSNLSRHIEYLLLRHDCVIVPGLGAFINSYENASLDFEKGIFTPPLRKVGFNREIKVDDGLLADSYCRKLNVNFEEARQIIVHEVSEIKDSLTHGLIVKIGNIGNLHLGVEDNLVFYPINNTGKRAEELGYLPISLPEKQDHSSDKEIDSTQSKEEQREEIRSDRYYYFKIRKIYLKAAASIALIMAAAGALFFYNPDLVDNKEQRASVMPVELLVPRQKEKKVEPQQTTAEEKEPATIETVSKKESAESIGNHLIIASFRSKDDAEEFLEEKSITRYNLEIIPPSKSNKKYLISAAYSEDVDELRDIMKTKDFTSRYRKAWIYSIRN